MGVLTMVSILSRKKLFDYLQSVICTSTQYNKSIKLSKSTLKPFQFTAIHK